MSVRDASAIVVEQVDSPIGRVVLAVRGGAVCALDFAEFWRARAKELRARYPSAAVRRARTRWRSWFRVIASSAPTV